MTDILNEDLVVRAREFAFEKHEGQLYGDDKELPFSYHLNMVVDRALQWGCIHEDILAACYLHDVLEDTDVTYEELVKEFNYAVASMVFDVTDEEGGNRYERWLKTAAKIRSSAASTFVKLCDRHSNMTATLEFKSPKYIGMYKKEYPVFKASLYDPWKFKTEWAGLDALFESLKEQNV